MAKHRNLLIYWDQKLTGGLDSFMFSGDIKVHSVIFRGICEKDPEHKYVSLPNYCFMLVYYEKSQ